MLLENIYKARDEMQAHLLRSVLDAEGIPARVLGGVKAQASIGPGAQVWVDEMDVARAKAVVARFDQGAEKMHPLPVPAPWRCPSCGETIAGQFTDCWSCLKPRPT